MGALRDVFEISREVLDISREVTISLIRFRDQTAAYNTLNQTIERLETMTANELRALKARLESNTTTIAEIAGDMANLKHFSETQGTKIDELTAALAAKGVDDPEINGIVTEMSGLVDAQQNSLSSIASQWAPEMGVGPNPTPAPPPGSVTTPGTTGPGTPTGTPNTPDAGGVTTTPPVPDTTPLPGGVAPPTPGLPVPPVEPVPAEPAPAETPVATPPPDTTTPTV